MQFIALDPEGRRILAFEAKKKIDYLCPECNSFVRLRKGAHVKAHFYHFRGRRPCQRRKKTLAHLNNQLYVVDQLPQGEAVLEHPFPTIGRIADVFWPAQKIVFEVQISSMTAEEAEAREKDYESLGFDLVWILHDTRYNKRRLTYAEQFFRTRNAYFTSIRTRGIGQIYDQVEVIRSGVRCFKGARLPIAVSHPYRMLEKGNRTIGFRGDLIDKGGLEMLAALEKKFEESKPSLFQKWGAVYRAFLYALLEKTLRLPN